jgi:catechol 2,3-dioxygenase-like lactoylglutathione lyase family enzyme
MQLSPEDGWSFLAPPNFMPEAAPAQEPPVFRPIALEDVVLNVSNQEKSAAFYQRVLGGPPVVSGNLTMWFVMGNFRIGLLRPGPSGQKPGVARFGIRSAAFDSADAYRRLERIGVKTEVPTADGAVAFRDIDGTLFQVSPAR